MYKIEYFGNPFQPRGFNHQGLSNQLIQKDFMEFEDEIQAYEFLLECSEPITKVTDIFKGGRVPIGLRKDKLVFQDMDIYDQESQD